MPEGYLAFVLHCHLPYVRHPEHEDFLEEDWLYEAVAETYVPLLEMLESLEAEGVPTPLTLSFSPTLCEMLANELLRARCVRYIESRIELAEREVARHRHDPLGPAARLHLDRFRRVHRVYVDRCRTDLLGAFRELARGGRVELIGSAATHALLPLLETAEGRRAQVEVGLRNFMKHFEFRPRGFWLPECAYEPGVEKLLAGFGMGYFFLDTHGILLAEPRPPLGVFAPLATRAGPFAFGRDVETSRQVWSADEGYPGHPDYREFYRDLGFDGELEYLRPYLPPTGARRYLGLKYHRITGNVPLDRKAPYDPEQAMRRANEHAAHFVRARLGQVQRVRRAGGADPIIVAPYDAELFGHWWFEGLWFLESVLRGVSGVAGLRCVTASEYLWGEPAGALNVRQEGTPAVSSWGSGGYFEVWLNGSNDWIYSRLHAAEREMVRLAAVHAEPDEVTRRALDQCARELMLAQASDWPFLMAAGGAADYARRRFLDLMDRFERLSGQVRSGSIDARFLERCEWLDDAFAEMHYAAFGPAGAAGGA